MKKNQLSRYNLVKDLNAAKLNTVPDITLPSPYTSRRRSDDEVGGGGGGGVGEKFRCAVFANGRFFGVGAESGGLFVAGGGGGAGLKGASPEQCTPRGT